MRERDGLIWQDDTTGGGDAMGAAESVLQGFLIMCAIHLAVLLTLW